MFASTYFAPKYFTPKYFPPCEAAIIIVTPPRHGGGGGGGGSQVISYHPGAEDFAFFEERKFKMIQKDDEDILTIITTFMEIIKRCHH